MFQTAYKSLVVVAVLAASAWAQPPGRHAERTIRPAQPLAPGTAFGFNPQPEPPRWRHKVSIAPLEARREQVRNRRQISRSQFQNAQQKANQYQRLLERVMKNLQENRQATIRNLQ